MSATDVNGDKNGLDCLFIKSGRTPTKCYEVLKQKIEHTFSRSYAKKGRPRLTRMFPEIERVLRENVESQGMAAAAKRDNDIALSGVTLKANREHLYKSIGGLAEHMISLDSIARQFVAPNKTRRSAKLYHGVINAKRGKKRNKLRRADDDAHFYHARVKMIRQWVAHYKAHCLEVSCDNKNKILVGSSAVSRHVGPEGFTMIDQNVEGMPDHDFPIPGYKIIPMGYMFMESIQGTENEVTHYDRLGRKEYKVPHSGELNVVLRAQKFGDSTVEPHVNDLLRIAPSKLNGRNILSILVDNGPDWNSGHTLNHVYFSRLFIALKLDVMIVSSQCPNYSAYNAIEHAWSPLTKKLGHRVFSGKLKGESVPPCDQRIPPEQKRAKEAVLFDGTMNRVSNLFNEISYGGHNVKTTFQPCLIENSPFNDHGYVKETIKKVTVLRQDAKLKAEMDFIPLHMVKRKDMVIFKKCQDENYSLYNVSPYCH